MAEGDQETVGKERLTESVEEYLEAIYKLECEPERVSLSAVAARLGFAPASVSQMVTRLREKGLVDADDGQGIRLTAEGRREGARLVRRHRLSERLLYDLLHLPWDRVHDEACRLEHAWSDESEERLVTELQRPETCPHGHAIPYDDACPHEVARRSLTDLAAGESGTITRVVEEESELLHYLASLGLLPATKVRIESIAPFNGPLLVRVGRSRYALGREVASKILIAE